MPLLREKENVHALAQSMSISDLRVGDSTLTCQTTSGLRNAVTEPHTEQENRIKYASKSMA